jgi:head-tail adaptor
MFSAGELRDRVRFEVRDRASANVGGVVRGKSWTPIPGEQRAKVKPLRGGEAVQAARLAGRDMVEIWLRGCDAVRAVTSDMRVVDARNAARTWNITAPPQNPDGRGQWYVITAEQGGSDG